MAHSMTTLKRNKPESIKHGDLTNAPNTTVADPTIPRILSVALTSLPSDLPGG
jgi:hypothetical protein